ncbi:MAG: transcriptional repressor [Treponema sp.]|jgi:Fur family ferric uptake transcriptional regulator|nr:transcriptional repressor [Treponema sp.]
MPMKTARSANYNTLQGRLILDYLVSLGDRHVTVNQIVQHFRKQNIPIGQTTIYRHLEKLYSSGTIRRYTLSEESACYQYASNGKACQEHFHLKCEQCGELIHLECDLLDEIQKHVYKNHSFRINALKTVFYGTCARCLKDGDTP